MRHEGSNMMKTVNVLREKLIQTVTENRTKHIADYQDALVVYRQLLADTLKQNSATYARNARLAKEAVSTGTTLEFTELKSLKSIPVMPVSYESAYDKALAMLTFSADEVIELDSTVFNQLVLDEWQWKHQFETTTAFYKSVGAVGSVR